VSIRKNLIGYLALFVALGGTSYGAARIPAGSVGTRQLRNGAVTAVKVRRHSLTASAFKAGALRALTRIQTMVLSGTLSFSGSCTGGTGGSAGECGLFGPQTYNVRCDSGQRVVGGGFMIPANKAEAGEVVTASRPFSSSLPAPASTLGTGGTGDEGWTVSFTSPQGVDESGSSVYSVCAS
jgi:hypothetical protein